jgi:large subunit ribosomal protein L25
MAKQIKLSAQTRSGAGRNSVKKLRATGQVPAVIYGATHSATNLQLGARQIRDVLAHATGEQMLVELEISGGEGVSSKLALIQSVQHHAVRGDILHVDFHAIAENEKLHAHVVVETSGESIGVKTYGGLLVMMLHSVEVECLPKDLPSRIVVDVSALNVGDAVHLRDLKLPEGVHYRGDADITVLRITGATVSEAPTAEGAPTQPEVIREKKPAEGADKK